MRRREEVSLALAEFTAALGQAPDETGLQQRYVDEVGRFLPGPRSAIYRLAPGSSEVVDVTARGVTDYFLALYEDVGRAHDPVFQRVLERGAPVYNRDWMSMDAWKSSRCYQEVLHLHHIDNSMQVPLLEGDKVVGILNFARPEKEGGFDAFERRMAATLGRAVSIALLSIRERQGAIRRSDWLWTALNTLDQPVVVTDLATAERYANQASRPILDTLGAAGTTLDDILAGASPSEGHVTTRELPLPGDGSAPATLHVRVVRRADRVEICFFELLPRGQQPRTASSGEELTPREREVAQLAAQGIGDRQIAEMLYLSPHTVKGYMKSCYRKLGINSRVALARLNHL